MKYFLIVLFSFIMTDVFAADDSALLDTLVKDVPTRIAFEARTKKGRLVNVEGDLKRGGDVIGKFKTLYGGRGMFAVTPTDSTDELTDGLHLASTFDGAFPPLAKPYSPYETDFMAEASYAENRRDIGYDPASNAFVLPTFTKVARRRWDKLDLCGWTDAGWTPNSAFLAFTTKKRSVTDILHSSFTFVATFWYIDSCGEG